MIPTVGRTVIYKLTDEETGFKENGFHSEHNGADELPAVIVRTWGDTEEAAVNLQVFDDGDTGSFWKTSVLQGNEKGEWHSPLEK